MSLPATASLIALAILIASSRFRRALWYPHGALPATILALFFLTASAAGPSLWDLSAPLITAGIPVTRPMTEDESNTASFVFLLCAVGPFVTAWWTSEKSAASRKSRVHLEGLVSPSVRLLLTIVAGAALMLWLIGQGDSSWASDDYRTPTGPLFIQRLANPLVPLSILIIGFLGITAESRIAPGRVPTLMVRLPWILFVLTWWVFLATKGTRSSIIAGAVLAFLLLWPRRPSLLRGIVAVLGMTLLALASVQYVLMARNFPLGASRFLEMTTGRYGIYPFEPTSLVDSIWFLAKNLSGFVFVTAASVARAPSQDLILTNLNPLPGARSEDTTAGIELYLPWVPLTTAGELYGAFGAFSVILLTTIIAICLTIAVRDWGQSRFGHFVALIGYGCIPLVLIWVSQYPTRNAFRITWILIALVLIRWVVSVVVGKRTHRLDTKQLPDAQAIFGTVA